jgi:hypothetical protein
MLPRVFLSCDFVSAASVRKLSVRLWPCPQGCCRPVLLKQVCKGLTDNKHQTSACQATATLPGLASSPKWNACGCLRKPTGILYLSLGAEFRTGSSYYSAAQYGSASQGLGRRFQDWRWWWLTFLGGEGRLAEADLPNNGPCWPTSASVATISLG